MSYRNGWACGLFKRAIVTDRCGPAGNVTTVPAGADNLARRFTVWLGIDPGKCAAQTITGIKLHFYNMLEQYRRIHGNPISD
jgi:hypothetical protein